MVECSDCEEQPKRISALEAQLAELHGEVCENGCATHEECTDACSCVGSGRSRLEVAEAELEALRDQVEQFHIPGCTHARTILIANCCQTNDLALAALPTAEEGKKP
jgi:hypothetical protein